MKLIIDRKKWLRGEGGPESRLLRSRDEKRCCIGIYLRECGVSDVALRDVGTASAVHENGVAGVPDWLHGRLNRDAYEAMSENDDIYIDDSEREVKIAKIFARHGVEVEFIN